MVSTVVIFDPLRLVDFVNFFGSRQAVFPRGLQKRWLAGEKDACESCSLAGPTVLALGCLVLAKQFDARMGRFQPPVPQVLAPELIQSSLASWQFDSNQFHALFIYLGCSPSTAYNARKKRRGGWEIGSAAEKPPWRL